MTSVDPKPENQKDDVDSGAQAGGSGDVNQTEILEVPEGAPSPPVKPKKKVGVTFAAEMDDLNRGLDQQKKVQSQRKKCSAAKNLKKENLAYLIQKKKECERRAHEIVLKLIETEVEKEFLLNNAIRISKQHLDDVIEERKLSHLCGWVLCKALVDPKDMPKQTYSIRGNKVYDITERKAFCDGKCYAKAVHFKAQLLTTPLWLRDMEENVQFEILDDTETTALHGLSVALTAVNLSDESEEEHDLEGDEEVTKSN